MPHASSYYVQVAVPAPLYQTFSYYIHDDDFAQAEVGARVSVPFGRQKLVGIIVEKHHQPPSTEHHFRLKYIDELLDKKSLFDTLTLQLLLWSAQYYQFPIGEVFHTALPTLLRQNRASNDDVGKIWYSHHAENGVLDKLSRPQQEAYRFLQSMPNGQTEEQLYNQNIQKRTLEALYKKGLVHFLTDAPASNIQTATLAQPALLANAEQQYAIEQISNTLGQYHGFLLDGLTGSGKTEVYLQVIAQCLAKQKKVLVLVPEIGLTPQTIARFQSRFHANITVLHSGLSDRQRLNAWLNAQSGHAHIILGTRSAIFTPIPNLGLIILDEEHDLSYKQQDSFRYHARDVALYRAYLQQCPIILGSATPSLESYYLVQQQKLTALQLNQRAGNATLPQFHTIDLTIAKKKYGFSQTLLEQMHTRLQSGEQVMIFLNRRGYAPVLFCESCAWQADCPRCDAHFTVHYSPYQSLHCHHCGLIHTMPTHCPKCQQSTLNTLGMGTAKVEQHLQQLLPNYPILRIDRDSASKPSDWHKFNQQIYQAQPLILLGTQMLSKGHHFPFVTLVAMLDVDAGFFSSDFRASERTAQQIMQVAGRAGREEQQGVVYLQTHRPDHPMLQLLLQYDYRHFAQYCLQERQLAQLPPYAYGAFIRVSSRQADYNLQFLQETLQLFTPEQRTHINIWGPIPAPMSRKAGYELAHLVLFAKHRAYFHQQIQQWWQRVIQLPKQHQLKITLDIDPQELS